MVSLDTLSNAMQQHRYLLLLWLLSTSFALAAHLTIAAFAIAGLVLFVIAAALTTTAGISSAYVVARDSI